MENRMKYGDLREKSKSIKGFDDKEIQIGLRVAPFGKCATII